MSSKESDNQPQSHELVVLKPKPEDSEIGEMQKRYYDAQAKEFDDLEEALSRRHLYWEGVKKFILESSQGYRGNEKIFSIGCGTGRKEAELKQAIGESVELTGIDPSKEMCKLSEAAGLKTKCIGIDAASMGELGKFDIALWSYAFPTLPSVNSRVEALKSVREILEPGGRLFLDVEADDDKYGWAPEVHELYGRESLEEAGFDLGDFFYRRVGTDECAFWHFFSEEELVSLVKKAGFDLVRRNYIGYFQESSKKVRRGEGSLIIEARVGSS